MTNRRKAADAEFPTPDAAATAHSAELVARIREAIAAAGGCLPFDRYMAMALYQPGLGYYSAGAARFGAGGDFTTAPLMSALFSRTLARQVAEVLARSDGDTVLEFGAGSGIMAADILAELRALDCLPRRYLILEVGAGPRAEQQRTITERVPELAARVAWLDRLPERPVRGVLLANEVLDALPVKRFQATMEGLRELVVSAGEEGFAWMLAPPAAELRAAVDRIEAARGTPLPPGYVSEWCPTLPGWIAGLAAGLERGAALLVDYGFPRPEFYHDQRSMGTLLCHYRHRAHDDPFQLPGLQDITAFVDFTAVAEAACASGVDVLGYNTQAHFLMGAGLPALLEQAMASDADHGAELAQQAKPLLFPGGLGERFKAIALGRNLAGPLAGFSLFDHRERLVPQS